MIIFIFFTTTVTFFRGIPYNPILSYPTHCPIFGSSCWIVLDLHSWFSTLLVELFSLAENLPGAGARRRAGSLSSQSGVWDAEGDFTHRTWLFLLQRATVIDVEHTTSH
jgi:hypothetical protein